MVYSSAATTTTETPPIQTTTTESSLNESKILPLVRSSTTTARPLNANDAAEIYDSPQCTNKEHNEKPQDLAVILMKNYSR